MALMGIAAELFNRTLDLRSVQQVRMIFEIVNISDACSLYGQKME